MDLGGSDLQHHFWLEWQRLNTPEHRERLDGGNAHVISRGGIVTIPLQLHVVHEGGQPISRERSRIVRRSRGASIVSGTIARRYAATLEVFGLASRYVPDRSRPKLSRDGVAFLGRASAERAGWRGHVIFWRGRNFIKEEGDSNYLSITRGGDRIVARVTILKRG